MPDNIAFDHETSYSADQTFLQDFDPNFDGWITQIGMPIASSAPGTTANTRFVIYRETGERLWMDTAQAYGTSFVWRYRPVSPAVRFERGEEFLWGAGWAASVTVGHGPGSNGDITEKEVYPPPDPLGQNTKYYNTHPITAMIDTLTNEAPLKPTWRTPSANGTTVPLSPTLQGNFLQDDDEEYDYIKEYQLKVYPLGNPSATVVDTTYTATTTERNQGYFSRTISGLMGGVAYGAIFRTRDSFDVWSPDFSAERTFTTTQGPNAPTPIGPTGKINVQTGFNYQATHSHPGPLNANAVQVIVTNNAGTTLYDSGIVTGYNVPNGGVLTLPKFHANLAWGTSYKWKMAVRDTANNWGGYTALQSFRTNAAPTPPTNLAPANNQLIGTVVLTSRVDDPDNDPVATAQCVVSKVSDGSVVTGYPKNMVVNAAAGTASYTVPPTGSGSLVIDTAYKWHCYANDGLGAGNGLPSEDAFFTYASVPTVGMVAPLSDRQNLIKQPSAERDATSLSAFWTTTDVGSGQTIEATEVDVAPFGSFVWRATANGSGALRFDTTDFIAVDATKACAFFVWARTVSGTPVASFQVLCYDAAGTLVSGGTIRPSSLLDMNALAPPAAWTRYGGIVSQIGGSATAFPANTTKVKIRVYNAASTGTLDFDAFGMSPLAYNPANTTERTAAQHWFGYADGDTTGFGPETGYEWTGAAGDSASAILPILSQPTGQSLAINYTSGSGKSNDRLLVERWDKGEWVQVADTNPSWATNNANRTLIPLPAGTVLNEGRYRLKVIVRNAILTEGDSGWVEFDVFYVGPPQLQIVVAEALPDKAQNRLAWTPSTIAGENFGAIEIQRIDPSGEEATATIASITDPTATEFVDHYPAAGRTYTYRIRQIEIAGLDQIGSFWTSAQLTCDYYPYIFLKDTENPNLYSAYETEAQHLVGYNEDAPVGILSPWGADRPTVLTRHRLRIRTGTVVGGFFPDAGIEIPDFPDAGTRFERAARIMHRRSTIAILAPAPEPIKVFAAVIGEARTTFPYPPKVRGIEFEWQEVSWSEDVYARASF